MKELLETIVGSFRSAFVDTIKSFLQSKEAKEFAEFTEFLKDVGDVQSWKDYARELHSAAVSYRTSVYNMYPIPGVTTAGTQIGETMAALRLKRFRIDWLLVGLAIECAIKGFIISSDEVGFSDVINSKGELDKKFAKHTLKDLVEKYMPQIELNVQEKHLLDLVSYCILWRGRYPTGKKKEQRNLVKTLDYDIQIFEDWVMLEDLAVKLYEALELNTKEDK